MVSSEHSGAIGYRSDPGLNEEWSADCVTVINASQTFWAAEILEIFQEHLSADAQLARFDGFAVGPCIG